MDGSIFIGTWWSLVPPLLAIVLALVTKEVDVYKRQILRCLLCHA